jgi:hypothetical protein
MLQVRVTSLLRMPAQVPAQIGATVRLGASMPLHATVRLNAAVRLHATVGKRWGDPEGKRERCERKGIDAVICIY